MLLIGCLGSGQVIYCRESVVQSQALHALQWLTAMTINSRQ